MWRFKAIMIGVFGILFFGGLVGVHAAGVESNIKMRSVSGEISWIDVKLGLLQLKSDAGQDTRGITEYRINQDETRVTDPTDKKFLVIKDLRAGQHVTIKLIDSRGETMARKIIAEPMPEPVLQEIIGELEAIDAGAGTLIVEQKPLPSEGGKGDLLYFVFEPRDIVVMKSPSTQPVRLELKPGDLLKVEFVVKDGKRHARSITLLQAAPETTSTTTTTTTSTTVIR
ncbi:MAG: hypothetical protein WC723_06585 [Candidatus Omnitrophota bacterium]